MPKIEFENETEDVHEAREVFKPETWTTKLVWGPNKKWRYELSVGSGAPELRGLRITRQDSSGISATLKSGVAIEAWGAIDLRGGEAALGVSQRPRGASSTQFSWLNSPGDNTHLALLLTTRHEQGDIAYTRLYLLDGASLAVLWTESIERDSPVGAFDSLELKMVSSDSGTLAFEILQHALPAPGDVQMPGPPMRLRFEADESGYYQRVTGENYNG